MFWRQPDGSHGETPDGMALPAGAEPIDEQTYALEVDNDRRAVQASVALAAMEEQAASNLAEATKHSAYTKLLALGLTPAEAAVLVGLPIPQED